MNLTEITNHTIEPLKPIACWEIHKYLGSMLSFQMGERIIVTGLSGALLHEGVFKISIRNVYWEALFGRKIIATSNDITPDIFAKELIPIVLNSEFLQICQEEISHWIRFEFSSSFSLRVDANSCMEDSGDKFEIILPDGRYVVLNSAGSLEALQEVEPTRSDRWRKKLELA
jgi:hypothetical protein